MPADKEQTQDKIDAEGCTIAISQTDSSEVDLRGMTLCGIHLPAAFTGTALTFKAATASGGTFQSVVDGAGAAVSKTVAQGQYVKLDPADFAGIQFIKIVSGSSEAAERTLTLALRSV